MERKKTTDENFWLNLQEPFAPDSAAPDYAARQNETPYVSPPSDVAADAELNLSDFEGGDRVMGMLLHRQEYTPKAPAMPQGRVQSGSSDSVPVEFPPLPPDNGLGL